MIRCGIVINDLTPSQLSFYLVNHTNVLLSKSVHNHFIYFINDVTPFFIQPLCPCLNSSEIIQFNDGVILTTNIDDTIRAIHAVNNSKIKFYVWDIEWIRKPSDYFANLEAFNSDKVEVIARSYDHAKIIQNYANLKKVRVVENCDLEQILCQN